MMMSPHKDCRMLTQYFAFLRIAPFLLLTASLSGCMVTRVSESTHAKEVDALHVVGLSMNAAKARVAENGFICSPAPALNHVQTEDGVQHRWLQLECSKQSMEVICPQIRSVVLNVDPKTNNVVAVGKPITQNSCF